jgi:hypothetical protein
MYTENKIMPNKFHDGHPNEEPTSPRTVQMAPCTGKEAWRYLASIAKNNSLLLFARVFPIWNGDPKVLQKYWSVRTSWICKSSAECNWRWQFFFESSDVHRWSKLRYEWSCPSGASGNSNSFMKLTSICKTPWNLCIVRRNALLY